MGNQGWPLRIKLENRRRVFGAFELRVVGLGWMEVPVGEVRS